jgi:hypothetical protein
LDDKTNDGREEREAAAFESVVLDVRFKALEADGQSGPDQFRETLNWRGCERRRRCLYAPSSSRGSRRDDHRAAQKALSSVARMPNK